MSVRALSVRQLHAWLSRSEPAPVLLDVRESWEAEICALPDSIFIPIGDIPSCLDKIPQDRPIVVLCHHGLRSMQVAHFLSGLGFTEIYNLGGGIDAWAREVELGMAVY